MERLNVKNCNMVLIPGLSSIKFDKYEHLTGEEILLLIKVE